MIPLYAFVEGDTLGMLLLAYPEDSCKILKTKLLQMAKSRVEPAPQYVLYFAGKVMDEEETVKSVGLNALDRVDLRVRKEQS